MKFLAGLLLLITCFTVSAQPSTTRGLAGYVEFGELSGVYGEPKVRINIGEKLLRFVAKMDRSKDPDTAEVLSNLKAVRVEVYRTNENTAPAVALVEKMTKELQSRDWEPVVIVSDKDDYVRILVKLSEDVIDGLVVMAVGKDDEAVFINIIGEIDPAQAGKVTKALDIDVDI